MIVITGATGHIGNVLVRELLSRGENVRAVVPPWEDTMPLDGLAVEIVEGDVRDVASLARAFEGADLVYHLAGIVAITAGMRELLDEVNVEGTRNVVQACLESGVLRLVYTSSIHAIEEPPHGIVIDEKLPFNPDGTLGDYGRSKAEASLEVLKGVEQGLDAVIVCPTGVIGPYDYAPSEMGQLMIRVAQGKLKASVEGAYNFVDVRDVATGLMLAAQKGRTGESYILSGERIAVDQLMAMLEEITGVKAPSFKVPLALARAGAEFAPLYYKVTNTKPLFTSYSIEVLGSNCLTTCAKARRELGYSPRPLRESVADAIHWFRENGKL